MFICEVHVQIFNHVYSPWKLVKESGFVEDLMRNCELSCIDIREYENKNTEVDEIWEGILEFWE